MNKKKICAQALVEFALMIPLFIFMVLIFIDLGRAIFTYSNLANSVREGTRYAIVHPSDTAADLTAIENTVLTYATALDPNNINITITAPTTANHHYITIVATYPYEPLTPGLSMVLRTSGPINFQVQSSALTAPLYWK